MIMKVRCGLMTATEAASQLGVSRKTYYKWEQRGLAALLDGVCDQKAGQAREAGAGVGPGKAACREPGRERTCCSQQMALKDLVAKINWSPGRAGRKKNERIMQAVASIEK